MILRDFEHGRDAFSYLRAHEVVQIRTIHCRRRLSPTSTHSLVSRRFALALLQYFHGPSPEARSTGMARMLRTRCASRWRVSGSCSSTRSSLKSCTRRWLVKRSTHITMAKFPCPCSPTFSTLGAGLAAHRPRQRTTLRGMEEHVAAHGVLGFSSDFSPLGCEHFALQCAAPIAHSLEQTPTRDQHHRHHLPL